MTCWWPMAFCLCVAAIKARDAVPLRTYCTNFPECPKGIFSGVEDLCWTCVNDSSDCRCVGSMKSGDFCELPMYTLSRDVNCGVHFKVPKCIKKHNSFKKCVDRCPSGFVKDSDDNCVESCPPGQRFVDSGECVISCGHKMVVNDTVCVDHCPGQAPLYHGKACVTRCPEGLLIEEEFFLSYENNRLMCKAKCEFNILTNLQYLWHGQRRCAHFDCPNGTFEEEREQFCTEQCPKNTVVFSNKCVENCPESTNKVVIGSNTHCVTTCPSDQQYVHDGRCLAQCDGHHVEFVDKNNNILCLNNCPPFTTQVNSSNFCEPCSDISPYYLNGICIEQCPKSYPYNNNGVCVEICPIYLKPDTLICEDKCPQPTPYFASGQCVANCPPHQPFIDESKCVSDCGKKYLVNGSLCFDVCPEYASSSSYCYTSYSMQDGIAVRNVLYAFTAVALLCWLSTFYIIRDVYTSRVTKDELLSILTSWNNVIEDEDSDNTVDNR